MGCWLQHVENLETQNVSSGSFCDIRRYINTHNTKLYFHYIELALNKCNIVESVHKWRDPFNFQTTSLSLIRHISLRIGPKSAWVHARSIVQMTTTMVLRSRHLYGEFVLKRWSIRNHACMAWRCSITRAVSVTRQTRGPTLTLVWT